MLKKRGFFSRIDTVLRPIFISQADTLDLSRCVRLGLGAVGGRHAPVSRRLNQARRFIPMRLDQAPTKGSMSGELYRK